jgi:hypothetical protein
MASVNYWGKQNPHQPVTITKIPNAVQKVPVPAPKKK